MSPTPPATFRSRLPQLPPPARLVPLVLGLLAAALAIRTIWVGDLWTQLLTGRLLLEQGTFPLTDDFSFTRNGARYNAHEWLVYAVFQAAFATWGAAGLLALVAIATGGAVWAAARGAVRRGADPRLVSLLGGALVWVLEARALVRPHVFSWPLIVLFVESLSVAAAEPAPGRARPPAWRLPAGLALAQAVWVNTHGSFILGPALAGLAFVARPTRRAAATLAAVAAACLATPDPVGTILFPFRFALEGQIRHVAEFEPLVGSPFFARQTLVAGLAALLAAMLLAAVVRSLRRAPRPWFDLGVAAAFVALAFNAHREVQAAALATFPFACAGVARPLGPSLGRLAGAAGALAVATALVAFLAVGYCTAPGRCSPPAAAFGAIDVAPAAEALARTDLADLRALSLYGDSGFLAWRLYPRLRVFIDPRLDLYVGDVADDYDALVRDPRMIPELVRKWGINAVVLPADWSPFLAPLAAQGFRAIEAGEAYTVLVRP